MTLNAGSCRALSTRICSPGPWLHQACAAVQTDGQGLALQLQGLLEQLVCVFAALAGAWQSPLPEGLCWHFRRICPAAA